MKYNRPQIAEAIANFFGIKGAGARDIEIAEQLQLSVPLLGVADSPYLIAHGASGCALRDFTSAAAEFPSAGVRPGQNVILQVVRAVVTVFATQQVSWGFVDGAAGVAYAGHQKIWAVSGRKEIGTTTLERLSSEEGADSALAFPSVVPAIGSMSILANVPTPIELPNLALYGNAPGGRPHFAITGNVANSRLLVAWTVREWELPG